MKRLVIGVDGEAFFRETGHDKHVDPSRNVLVGATTIRMPGMPGTMFVNGEPLAYTTGSLDFAIEKSEKPYEESVANFYVNLVTPANTRRPLTKRQLKKLLYGNRPPGSERVKHVHRVLNTVLCSHADLVKAADPVAELWTNMFEASGYKLPDQLDPDLRVMRESFVDQVRALEKQPWGLDLAPDNVVVRELAHLADVYCERAAVTRNAEAHVDYSQEQEQFAEYQRMANAYFTQKTLSPQGRDRR